MKDFREDIEDEVTEQGRAPAKHSRLTLVVCIAVGLMFGRILPDSGGPTSPPEPAPVVTVNDGGLVFPLEVCTMTTTADDVGWAVRTVGGWESFDFLPKCPADWKSHRIDIGG